MPKVLSRFRIGLLQGMCWGVLFSGIGVQATPDLIVDERLLANVAVDTRTFNSGDCSVIEGCTMAGERRLLLFDVGLANVGSGDLVIGNPAQRPDLFHFSACHGHYHMDGTAGYELLTTNGQTVVTARKQGFCFRDDAAYLTNAGTAKFNCDYQGISIGWEDIYDRSLDCQWLDITGLAGGDYILRVVVNPDALLVEENYNNNVAEVLVTITGSITNTPPPPPPPTNKPPKCVNHDDWQKWWDWKKLHRNFKGHLQKKCKIPHCTCKCHKPPTAPGKGGGDQDDHDAKGGGKKGDNNQNGKGNGGKGKGDNHGKGKTDNHGKAKGKAKGGAKGNTKAKGGGNGKDCKPGGKDD